MIIQKTALWREKQKCVTLCWGEVKKSVNQLYLGIEEDEDFSQVNTEQLCKGTCNQGFYAGKWQIMQCFWRTAFILKNVENINEKLGFLGEIK